MFQNELHSKKFKSLVFLLALGLAPFTQHTAFAGGPKPKLDQSQAGYYRLKLGNVNVIALSDGTIALDTAKELSKPEEAARMLAKNYVKLPPDVSVNAFLILLDKRVILVDAGAGEILGPSLNKLTSSLKTVGIEPGQVTDILVTHIHPDHTGGLSIGGRRVFENAVVHVSEKELDFWTDKAAADKAQEPTKTFFKSVDQTIGPYLASGQVKTFQGDTRLFPGVRTVAAYGHTPGQSYYLLEDSGQKLEFWGDTVHVQEVQFDDPSVTISFDQDQKQAGAQRLKAFSDAAKNGYLVAMPHISFPGLGRVRRDGDHFTWIPVPYVNDAQR
ncbi:MBL fold metallo-hydrolase [Phyllobacterium endophyticum]|uniref:MBL fold metallo-hydrolase n=1 Tax=Phyllobacterium endophyticum TaxID=1149773 RepID=UPI00164F5857|nr:MBL fold metallo-hydrolase [Phyllobacterium endophyticum]